MVDDLKALYKKVEKVEINMKFKEWYNAKKETEIYIQSNSEKLLH